jgi:hypothetical protein
MPVLLTAEIMRLPSLAMAHALPHKELTKEMYGTVRTPAATWLLLLRIEHGVVNCTWGFRGSG